MHLLVTELLIESYLIEKGPATAAFAPGGEHFRDDFQQNRFHGNFQFIVTQSSTKYQMGHFKRIQFLI